MLKTLIVKSMCLAATSVAPVAQVSKAVKITKVRTDVNLIDEAKNNSNIINWIQKVSLKNVHNFANDKKRTFSIKYF